MASTDLYASSSSKVDKGVAELRSSKRRYYALARKVHPRQAPRSDEQAKDARHVLALKKAYDILSDPVRRRRYVGRREVGVVLEERRRLRRPGPTMSYSSEGIPFVSEEDIRATEAEYRHSDEERTDVVASTERVRASLASRDAAWRASLRRPSSARPTTTPSATESAILEDAHPGFFDRLS